MSEENLSILSLILNASVLVQAVMAILFLASAISWVMIIQRGMYLSAAQRDFRQFEETFWSGIDLNSLYREISEQQEENVAPTGIENIFRAGFGEFNRLVRLEKPDPDAVIESTDRAMRIALSREEESLGTHLPFLASVASAVSYTHLTLPTTD